MKSTFCLAAKLTIWVDNYLLLSFLTYISTTSSNTIHKKAKKVLYILNMLIICRTVNSAEHKKAPNWNLYTWLI